MDYPHPPPEGDRPPEREEREGEGDGDRPPRQEPRFSPFTIIAVFITIVVAVIAVLLGQQGGESRSQPQPQPQPQPPQSPGPPQPGQAFLTRIDLDELLRITKPLIPLYKQRLAPFNKTSPHNGSFDIPDIDPPKAQLRRAELADATDTDSNELYIRPVTTGQRIYGLYPSVGKVISRKSNKFCTGAMVGENVMITADHCLPWNQTADVWESIQFIPAYNASATDDYGPTPYAIATVTRCVGINPPIKGSRDMAVCDLAWPDPGPPRYVPWAPFDWPDDESDEAQEAWYRSRMWHSIGYPDNFHDGEWPAQYGGFMIGEGQVKRDPPQNCTLLRTPYFAYKGWSGGPAFALPTPEKDSAVIAIVTGCSGPDGAQVDCDVATVTELAGGLRMGALIVWGLDEWDPKTGFNESSPMR
ncbi:hypothetical protein B0T16DRAFT_417987 [Cercophora newfieldiana]|uniref:Serine protease n=1 Tax=Cercophora newfieldiana TaxID=92897 RepID=A0AA40CPL2_9PEZI|nr:hypothetical protein B0T16DRAFT_417987 [Cercophora newfieldiana]